MHPNLIREGSAHFFDRFQRAFKGKATLQIGHATIALQYLQRGVVPAIFIKGSRFRVALSRHRILIRDNPPAMFPRHIAQRDKARGCHHYQSQGMIGGHHIRNGTEEGRQARVKHGAHFLGDAISESKRQRKTPRSREI